MAARTEMMAMTTNQSSKVKACAAISFAGAKKGRHVTLPDLMVVHSATRDLADSSKDVARLVGAWQKRNGSTFTT
jgi:hypothetical protein